MYKRGMLLVFLILVVSLFLTGCFTNFFDRAEEIPEPELNESSEPYLGIRCLQGYIPTTTSCCRDTNENEICDEDEQAIQRAQPITEVTQEETPATPTPIISSGGGGGGGGGSSSSSSSSSESEESSEPEVVAVTEFPWNYTQVQWTTFTPSSDTRIVYLSNSTGNDSNDCLSPSTPCKTVAKGVGLLRDTFPDWLLFKRGDNWTRPLSSDWNLSGRSNAEKMILGSYGNHSNRPLFNTGGSVGFSLTWTNGKNGQTQAPRNLAIVGLDIFAHTFDHLSRYPNGSVATNLSELGANLGTNAQEIQGIIISTGSANILIEDTRVRNFGAGMVIQAQSSSNVENVTLRRNVVIDNYADRANSQGLYLASITNLTLEENIIDYNGWHENVSNWTVFDHNAYIAYGSDNATVRGNIVARGDGLQVRDGGLVENNVFIRTAIALSVGVYQPNDGGKNKSGTITHNVFLEGTGYDGLVRGFGIDVANIGPAGLEIERNIFANNLQNGQAFQLPSYNDAGNGVINLSFHDNIIYNWSGSISFYEELDYSQYSYKDIRFENNTMQKSILTADQSFIYLAKRSGSSYINLSAYTFKNNTYSSDIVQNGPFRINGTYFNLTEWNNTIGAPKTTIANTTYTAPNRTVRTYSISLGHSGDLVEFMNLLRNMSKGTGINQTQNDSTWNISYTADTINDYFREGFDWNTTGD